jgi:hypothetical protein
LDKETPPFISFDVVQEAVGQWFRQQPKEFFADRTSHLIYPWDCLNACGDFFSFCSMITFEDLGMDCSCMCLMFTFIKSQQTSFHIVVIDW